MKMIKLNDEDCTVEGDVFKLRSNEKAIPVKMLLGLNVRTIKTFLSTGEKEDFEGVYRPVPDQTKIIGQKE